MKINIFLSAAVIMALFSSCGGSSDKSELFNGKDLSGWECFVHIQKHARTKKVKIFAKKLQKSLEV